MCHININRSALTSIDYTPTALNSLLAHVTKKPSTNAKFFCYLFLKRVRNRSRSTSSSSNIQTDIFSLGSFYFRLRSSGYISPKVTPNEESSFAAASGASFFTGAGCSLASLILRLIRFWSA